MKLSFLLELLLILIIIAFAASMPVKEDRENVRKLKRISNAINVKQNIGLTSSTPVSIVADDDDDDDDDDDLFDDLVDDDEDEDDSGVKKDPKGPGDQESEDSDDEDDLFGLADDEAEKDTPSDEEEEEFDGSELILFGEDIFQAVFDDDDEDTNKKKKPEILNNTVNALLVTAPPSTVQTVAPVKDQLSSTGHKDTELKPSNLNQKLANKTEILTEVNSNKNEKLTTLKPAVQLYLQHTPALLELAQSTLSHDASTAPDPNTAIKHEESQSTATPSQQDTVSAIHPVQYSAQITEKPDLIYEENDEEKFDESETNVDDDLGENEELIVVPDDKNENDKPIEEIKNPEEEEEGELLEDDDKQPEEQKPDEEEIVKDPLPIADDSENIIPQNDKLTLGPGQIVSEQQQSEVAQQLISAQQTESIKKPNKEEDESILGIVESIIFDEDEDETDSSKPIKTDTTTNNQDKNDETLEDEEDEVEDDESEDDEDEDDDEKDEVQKPSVTTTTTTTSTTSSPTPNKVNNTIKKKKKKQSSLLGALEESLGLSRIMQSEKIKKGKGKNKSKK